MATTNNMQNDKYISRGQMQTLLDARAKGTEVKPILDSFVAKGYTIEGVNDKPVAPVVETPKKGLFERATEKAASIVGGEKIAQGIGQALNMGAASKQLQETQTQQFDQQGQLLKLIKEGKAAGQDVSRLEKALEYNQEDIDTTAGGAEQLLNPNELTDKQVIGDALQLGTTIIGAGALPGVAKNTVAATTIGQGIKQGAIQGAKAGTAFGASSGVSSALEADKSALDIAKGGIGGALVGAGTGALLGGAIGGVSGGIKGSAARKQAKENDFTLDLVSPKATEQIKQQALREGRVTEQTLLSGGKITPSKRDVDIAESVKGIVSSKKSAVENINSLKSKVDDINTGVKAYVRENKTPFNTNQLKSQLNQGKEDLDLIFASDKAAEKTYDAVRNKFIELVKNKDTAGLLDARQQFDKIPAVRKLLESDKLGENARKEIVLTMRSQANKYIASLLPEGNTFRETLLKESRMLEALGNIAEKNTSAIGVNGIQAIIKKYPVLKWLAGGVGAGGVAAGGAAIVNSI